MSEQSKLTLAAALERLAYVGESLERELRDNQPLLRDIKELLDALSDVWVAVFTSQTKWISVKERLPGENICVLVSVGFPGNRGSYTDVAMYDGELWVRDAGSYFDIVDKGEVTHWMPLPEPPKEEDDDRH